jgi:hypothetical protein
VASQEDLAVLVNRPLNAMPPSRSGMIRIADVALEGEAGSIEDALRTVSRLEEEYQAMLAPKIPHAGKGTHPKEFFNWAQELGALQSRLQGLEHWEQIEHQMIAPHVNQVLQAVPRLLNDEATAQQWQGWRDRYLPQLLTLLSRLRRQAAERSRIRTGRVAALIDPLLPDWARKESLSRKALWVLASTPGVTCVLNGMRTVSYAKDSTAILGWERLDDAGRVYRAVAELTDV